MSAPIMMASSSSSISRVDFLSSHDKILNLLGEVLLSLPNGLLDLFKDRWFLRFLLIPKQVEEAHYSSFSFRSIKSVRASCGRSPS